MADEEDILGDEEKDIDEKVLEEVEEEVDPLDEAESLEALAEEEDDEEEDEGYEDEDEM